LGCENWNELIDSMLALNDAFLVVLLCGRSSSVSSISIEWSLALFLRGTLVIFAFAFAFSMRACRFLLTSGIVFEGNILAT